MTSQGSKANWRRAVTGAVAGGAVAAGLMIGVGAGTAQADVLTDIYNEYDTGAGGGQISNLIHVSMKLRSLGFVPSKGNISDLEAAMDKRPNQGPLVEALNATVGYQRRNQMRAQAQTVNPATIGINQLPPGQQQNPTNPDNSGIFIAPGGTGTNSVPIG